MFTEFDNIEEHWQQLAPVFILGRQRTGTSIMWRALREVNFLGFPEGHLWYDLIKAIGWWRNPTYKASYRNDLFTMGDGRNLLFEKYLALLIDRFHRDLLPAETIRWVSKSPGVEPVQVAPMLAELFPKAQFIFMYRNPITVVHSTLRYLAKDRQFSPLERKRAFRLTCELWGLVMRTWRFVRPLLQGRYIEIAQEHIVVMPDEVAHNVADFLHIPQQWERIAYTFKHKRENTAFPERKVGDFFYPIQWSRSEKRFLTATCKDEMALWGYQLDFRHPAGPLSSPPPVTARRREDYYRWLLHPIVDHSAGRNIAVRILGRLPGIRQKPKI